ncbi:class I SAM-dependent methyltransferase [Thiocapsa bogorovii]|uniref:class I SAM-dependent methyltransferase n=1 Tax=Thiocapsa bogorovii TaxID=521689 RepID=UPI001E43CF1E|nr:class I SAM-dependent methyltransferase [Thiocapsa bogorovii]UHD15988.1 class I SAM-dependent methyltransferase [Thiocapsa bogorovii]
MGDFDADWLRLRAPADSRARAADLPVLLRPHLPKSQMLRVLDLGCGTGSNLRTLAPILGGPQAWLCLDADDDLLARVTDETRAWAQASGLDWDATDQRVTRAEPHLRCSIATRRFDLVRDLSALPLEGIGLVTASALLDLVSETWLAGLVSRCAKVRVPILMALTYDGRVAFEPALSLDREVIEAVNRHQGRDKGFGPALGPGANARLAILAAAEGYWVEVRRSDWRIRRSERELQTALIRGWSRAAREESPASDAAGIAHWETVRLAAVERGCSRINVGHRDLLAIPPRT